jgi:multidrug resistance efflux pump
VLGFDGSTLMQELGEKKSKLAEKQRELDKLLLDLAERERTERLAVAQARAELEKAQRKTRQPQALIPGTEYKKLVIARELAEGKMALQLERQAAATEQRRQERRMLEAEVAQLQGEVDRLQGALAALDIAAPRDGLMMHKTTWSGEKYDVGSQAWRGQPIAEIPDLDTLAVRGQLPERELTRVEVGMPARVVVEGGAGVAVRGTVQAIGQAVRSKSRVQPVPIVDLEIALDQAAAARLKPGQAVRIELDVPSIEGATERTLAGADR